MASNNKQDKQEREFKDINLVTKRFCPVCRTEYKEEAHICSDMCSQCKDKLQYCEPVYSDDRQAIDSLLQINSSCRTPIFRYD